MQNFLHLQMSSVWTTSKLHLIFFNVLCPLLQKSPKFSLVFLGKVSEEFWSIIFGMPSGFNWELWMLKRTVLCLIFLRTLKKFIQAAARRYDNWVLWRHSYFCISIYARQKILIKRNIKNYLSLFFSLILSLKYYLFLIIFNGICYSRQCEFHVSVRAFITLLKPDKNAKHIRAF